MEYRVNWTIDLDADSPGDAARQALAIQRDPNAWATHFTVRDSQGNTQEVDLGCPATPSRSGTVYVLVPKEEGIVHYVRAFQDREAALAAEGEWLAGHGLTDVTKCDAASDWGLGIAIWECEMET